MHQTVVSAVVSPQDLLSLKQLPLRDQLLFFQLGQLQLGGDQLLQHK